MANYKATWKFDENEDPPTLRCKVSNGEMTVMFFTRGNPPQITLCDPSGGDRLLEGDEADAFRAWLIDAAAAAKPRVKAD